MRRRSLSLQARVTWVVIALLGVVLVSLFTAVDIALSSRLHAEARTRLTDRVALARELQDERSTQRLVDRLEGDGVVARLCVRDGAECVAAAAQPGPPGPGAARQGPGRWGGRQAPPAPAPDVEVEQSGSVLFVSTELSGRRVLTLSLDTTQITDALNRLIFLEVAGGLVALLLAGLAASRLARTALRPLADMTTLARRIAAGDRGRRLGAAGSGPDKRRGAAAEPAPTAFRPGTELGRTAAAFDAMLDELEAAEARMRAFLSDASHELRTPLAGLQANAELLLREDPDRAERERVAVAMVRESRRAARLVDDLLTMARLGQGVPIVAEPVDLMRLAGPEVERARTLAPDLTVELTGPAGVIVQGDPVRLGQIVTNLLDNARHATPAGGTVTVSVRRPAGRVWLDVADTGPGVAPADRGLIFERFGRGDVSRSRNTGGAGLGLPIARGLAQAHGGDLTYVDTGPGARFRLDLPAGGPGPAGGSGQAGGG